MVMKLILKFTVCGITEECELVRLVYEQERDWLIELLTDFDNKKFPNIVELGLQRSNVNWKHTGMGLMTSGLFLQGMISPCEVEFDRLEFVNWLNKDHGRWQWTPAELLSDLLSGAPVGLQP